MGKRNNTIIISAVLVAFIAGTIFSSPNYAVALPPWANDILVRIGLLETTTVDLQNRLGVLENDSSNSISCENQIAINSAIDGFNVDEDCFTGYDLGLTLEGPNILSQGETATYTVHIQNLGPDDAQNIQVLMTLADEGFFYLNEDTICPSVGSKSLICIIESLNNGESDSFTFDLGNLAGGNNILDASVTDTIFPAVKGDDNNSFSIFISN